MDFGELQVANMVKVNMACLQVTQVCLVSWLEYIDESE